MTETEQILINALAQDDSGPTDEAFVAALSDRMARIRRWHRIGSLATVFAVTAGMIVAVQSVTSLSFGASGSAFPVVAAALCLAVAFMALADVVFDGQVA